MTTESVSIILPAHNEAAVLGSTLDAVFAQDYPGPMEVIVAANGCDDETVDVAEHYRALAAAQDRELHVLDLPGRGKPGALNAADAIASGDVRIYLDADVTISGSAVSCVVGALQLDGIEFAAPAMLLNRPRSRVVRGYLTVWSRMPYVVDGDAGRGVYAVSAKGRSRWGSYPDLLSDDSFARLHFESSEVAIVNDATVAVRFPETLREMIAVRGRLFRGIWELDERLPELGTRHVQRGRVALRTVARSPDLWLRAPAFLAIYVFGWLHARRTLGREDAPWARAESSRVRP